MNSCDVRVVAVQGRMAVVEVGPRPHACAQCPNPGGCGSPLDGLGGVRRLRVANDIGARVGDAARLEVAVGTVWNAAFFAYLLPVLIAIAGAAVGQPHGDGGAMVGLAVGLGLGFGLLHLVARRLGRRRLVSLCPPVADESSRKECS